MTWQPPETLAHLAIGSSTLYRNAPLAKDSGVWSPSAKRVQMPLHGGLVKLRTDVVAAFPAIRQTYMPGRSREKPIPATDRLDMHQAGRACDFMVKSMDLGDYIATWLIERIEAYRIQFIVWDHMRFSAAFTGAMASRRWGPYTGKNPHTDHVHVEVMP